MAMNTKPRLYQRLAFNLIVAVVIGVCFGARPGVAQSTVGAWSPGPTWPEFPVHAHLLPTGKVMIWPGDQGISGNNQQPQSWIPGDQNVSPLTRVAGYDLFCSGHSLLADGKLFVAGGHIQNNVGVANASIYDPGTGTTGTWTALPDMNAGRWYPTATVLANGDVLVVSGSIDNTVGVNRLPQVYGSGTWRDLTSAQLGQDLYPFMLLAPNGTVFNPGPTRTTRYLDTAGSGTWSLVANRAGPYRDYGSAVMYAPGKVLVMGGGDPPTNTAEVINLNDSSPSWRAVGSMAVARRQLNATLLPDGTVLVTGGTSRGGFNTPDDPTSAVHNPELWNPTTEQWTTLAPRSAPIPRIYHSSALLLPDARVLSMGGNGQLTSEIYSPPYLFNGARPTITSAPTSVAYGQTYFVGTPDAAAISKVTMLRLSSVTHAFNMSQYISTLSFSQAAGGLNVVAPSGATAVAPPTVAPPGYYLLFILNGSGVPSVGRIVRIGSGGSGPAAPTSTSLLPSSAAAGGPAFTLTVNGSNFVSGSVVLWNGTSRNTTFVSLTQLTAAIPAADIAAAGSASVTVRNPDQAVSNALTFTITGANASSTIWPTSALPAVVDGGPDNAVQLGVKFRSDVAGTIRGIRFYKSAGNTGTHVASLWSTAGTRLATATFTNETASGWQEVSFATPVSIIANTTYVASYHTTTGHYSFNGNYFTAGVDNPPLHALASAGSGGNGVYRYGTNSAFSQPDLQCGQLLGGRLISAWPRVHANLHRGDPGQS